MNILQDYIYIAVIILFQIQCLHRKYNSTYLPKLSLYKRACGFMYIYFIKLEDLLQCFSGLCPFILLLKVHLPPAFQFQLTCISHILMVPIFHVESISLYLLSHLYHYLLDIFTIMFHKFLSFS